MDKGRRFRIAWLPSAEEIQQAAALIREEWTAEDFVERSGGLDRPIECRPVWGEVAEPQPSTE